MIPREEQQLRRRIRNMLLSWRDQEIDEGDVHRSAEALMEQLGFPEYGESDPRSIGVEVLSQLEILNHQLVVPEDIPAMLELLATPEGNEEQALETWTHYWNSLDYEERKRRLKSHGYYSV